ncbi:MAG: diguanylate cyclase [Leptothrix sp. (in: b-proteobacteria)]
MTGAPASAPLASDAALRPAHDLTEAEQACEREPIHLPGSIQPHGALVAFDDQGVLLQVSANLAQWLPARDHAAGHRLADLIGEAAQLRIDQALAHLGEAGQHALIELPARPAQGQTEALSVLLHRHAGVAIAEFEPCTRHSADPRPSNQGLRETLEALRSASNLTDLQHRCALRIRQLIGCDRVMVYRFHADWHGEVMADAHAAGMESFLGLHFPAGDIPSQARALYLLNPVRYVADVDAEVVGLQPCIDDARLQPLDLSHAVLRSVSPVHLQYLRHMGVGATLTLSIRVDGRLWGLVACHHRTPLALSLGLRQACHELSFQVGLMIGWAEQRQQAIDLSVALQAQGRIVDAFNRSHLAIAEMIERCHADLLALVEASGGAFWRDDQVWPFGHWPAGELGAAVLRRVRGDFDVTRDDLLASEAVALTGGHSAAAQRQACGLLALRLDAPGRIGLVWLRPEQRREVVWGGDPDHPVQVTRDARGQPQISPRTSFARWEQLVEGRSRPWTPGDLSAARSLLGLREVLNLRDALAESRRSDSQFRSLVAVQADAYWQIDPQGTLMALSKPLRAVSGSVFGRGLVELLGPLLEPASLDRLRRALARREPFRDLRISGLHAVDGQPFEYRLNGTPMRGADGTDAGWHGTLSDISTEMKLLRELAQRDAVQQAMLDNDLVASVKVHEGRISWANRAMERLFGGDGPALIGRTLLSLCADPAAAATTFEHARAELAAGRTHRSQLEMRHPTGRLLWIDLSGMVLSPATGESMWLMNDLTAMRALQVQAEHQARHDSLTRLPNRALLQERLDQALAAANRRGEAVAVCYLDLDGFKPINDNHGHAAGDEVLRSVAQRLLAMVRRDETVARLGGDEFVILLPRAGPRAELASLLQRLVAAVAQPVRLGTGIAVSVCATVGVAVSPDDGMDARALLSSADVALYAGKAEGGNRYRFASRPDAGIPP